MYNLLVTDFSKWLNQKFLEWQYSTGERQSLLSFSKYLNVKYSSLSGWINSEIPPSGENLQKLADKLGYDIYAILGVIPPYPPFLHEAKAIYASLPPDEQKAFEDKFIATIKEWLLTKE